MERSCPSCKEPLRVMAARTQYGLALEIDQCPSCRGIYLDQGELLRIGKEFIRGFEEMPPPPAEKADAEGAPCPGCNEILVRLRESQFPEHVHAFQCAACRGLWLSEDDLLAFHRFRERRLAEIRKDDTDRSRKQRAPVKPPSYPAPHPRISPLDALDAGLWLLAPPWVAMGATIFELVGPVVLEKLKKAEPPETSE